MPYSRRSVVHTVATPPNWLAAKVVGLIPAGFQKYAKALVPAAAAVVTVGVTYVTTGHFDATALKAAEGMAAAAVLSFFSPNA